MVGKWLMVLPLLVGFDEVTLHPLTREARQMQSSECSPCPEPKQLAPGAWSHGRLNDELTSMGCICPIRGDDAEASASILMPSFRAVEPFVKQPDQKTESKPLLQPEVGLASSVLETLRQATDEEYQEALARDVARSAVKLIETTLNPLSDALTEATQNKVTIFLNSNGDDMNDNLPEQSHIQETRCVHLPFTNMHKNDQLTENRPIPIFGNVALSHTPVRKLKNKSIHHRHYLDMDNEIGASNIQERVSQPNLLSLTTNYDIGTTEDQKEEEKNISDAFNPIEKGKGKIHLKLKEIIDNLEVISKKQKSKVPTIDFKKYDSITLSPPLKLKPIPAVRKTKPLLLKDLIKLKDVELVPQNFLTKNNAAEKFSNTNFKVRPESSTVRSSNRDIDTCKEDNRNVVPVTNNDNKMIIETTSPEIADTEISPTNLNPTFESKSQETDDSSSIQSIQNTLPLECIARLKNRNMSSYTKTIDLSHNSFGYDEGEYKENSNVEQIFSNNCNELITSPFMQHVSKNYNKNENSNDIELKDEAMNMESSEDIHNEELSNEAFQIQLFEDLDMPIKFDNESLIYPLHLENNNNVQDAITNNEDTFNDSVSNPSNTNMYIVNNHYDNLNMAHENCNKNFDDCNSQDVFEENPNFILEHQSSCETIQENNSMLKDSPESTMVPFTKSLHDISSNINEYPREVSFKDLQDMSDSILNLSEHEETDEKDSNINYLDISLDEANDVDIPNTVVPVPILEKNSKEKYIEKALDTKSNLKTNSDSHENLCVLTDETLSNANNTPMEKTINYDTVNFEMEAEATDPESKSYDIKIPLIQNYEQNRNNLEVLTDKHKHSKFLSNLKLKLDGVFSTTEKVIISKPEDTTNESSNINAVLAKFDKFQNLKKSDSTPQVLLQKVLTPKLPEMSLNTQKNKLTQYNYVGHPLMKNSLVSNFPTEMLRPYEDPKISFTALSDRLRSHTENAILNVKETLESTLKDSPSFRLSRPTDTIGTNDILESMSNKRDDMKEKLEAIHLDLNDRFSSFQQSILNHFNVPLVENSDFRKDSDSMGSRASYIPEKKELSLPKSKLEKVIRDHNPVPFHMSIPNNIESTGINLKLPRIPLVSDETRFINSDRKLFPQTSILHSTTTAIPSFTPRLKVLKTNTDFTPRLTSEILSNSIPSKVPIMSEDKTRKIKTSLLKSGPTNNYSKDRYSSPNYTPKISIPLESFTSKMEDKNKKDLSIDSSVNKLRKAFFNKNQTFRNELPNNRQEYSTGNALENLDYTKSKQKTFLSRTKEGRSRNNDELIISASSRKDTMHPSENEAHFQLVEPLKENVPYKCKLICYKDE